MAAPKHKKVPSDLSAEIKPLIRKLRATLGTENSGTILTFMAARPGEGTTTVVHSFAHALSADTGKKTLIIEVDAEISGTGSALVECVAMGADINKAITNGVDGVFFARWAITAEGQALSGRVIQDKAFWQSLQSSFDTIVIDVPSLQRSSDGIAFAHMSAVTILVVEAEATRKEVIENLRDTLTAANAKIAGVIMTNRTFYIPEKIYKRL